MSILQDIADDDCEMEMTPMIDVTFLLLIFFMCTIKFKTLEGKLSAYLPKDVGVNTSPAEPKEKIEVEIRVITEGTKHHVSNDPFGRWSKGADWTGEGRYSYEGRVVEYGINVFRTRDPEKVRRRLKEQRDQDVANIPLEENYRDVTINPLRGTVYRDVVTVLDACLLAGFVNITFIGSFED